MKKQWVKFLEDNQSNWSYDIVPALVRKLAMTKDSTKQAEIINNLALQGIVITSNGNLDFAMNQIFNNLF